VTVDPAAADSLDELLAVGETPHPKVRLDACPVLLLCA